MTGTIRQGDGGTVTADTATPTTFPPERLDRLRRQVMSTEEALEAAKDVAALEERATRFETALRDIQAVRRDAKFPRQKMLTIARAALADTGDKQ